MKLLDDLVERAANATGLDPTIKSLTSWVHKLTDPAPVKNVLSGAWLGHQAHPMFTDVPIGAWAAASILDLVGGPGAAGAARTLAGTGILAALPTAATGASDWSETYGGEQRVGLVHAVSNSIGLTCWTLSWLQRRRGGSGRLLGLLGTSAVGLGGYLGGHLSFRMGIGVDRTAHEHRPADWVDVCALDDLGDGTPRRFEAGGVPVVVVRTGLRVDALSATCNHAGGPLDEGKVVDGCIQCPWHQSSFRLADGAVRRGPAAAPQPHWETRVDAGRVAVRSA